LFRPPAPSDAPHLFSYTNGLAKACRRTLNPRNPEGLVRLNLIQIKKLIERTVGL
jgi:hypothetical protein